MVATSCDLNAPRCTTTVPAGTFARVPGRCLRWSPISPGPPVTTCKNRSFTSIQMVTVLHGRHGPISHPLSFCMAGVAQSHICLRFAWQAWHSWAWVARLGRFCRGWRRGTLRGRCGKNLNLTVLHGRRGASSHPPSFYMADVAQSHIRLRFRGRRRAAHGTGWRAWAGLVADDAAAFCVEGVAHIHLRSAWQAWHNLTSAFVLRGRRATHGTGWRAWAGLVADGTAALCVAGVAHIHLRFAWQAWRNLTSAFALRGRRATHGTGWRAWAGLVADDAEAFCVAGVAQSHIHLRFTWQVWRNLTAFVLRGRRGTHGTWAGLVVDDAAALCVAGVAQSHIHLRFAWQAWHNLTFTFVLRGTRGTHGTGWRAWAGLVADDAAALCVAGVAQSHIHLRFTWQAWRNLTSVFVLPGSRFGREWRRGTLRGRRGTISHPPSFCVANMAQSFIHLRFTCRGGTHGTGRRT